MLVYLVRHGEAVSEREDPARPLSKQGEAEIIELAGLLAHRFELMPGFIFHSPKLRAAQTASLIGQALPRAPAPEEAEGLRPMDDPAAWAERLEVMDRDTMIVGHLPHLPRLASMLLLSDSSREILDLTPGTVVCLEKTGAWRVKWMISPDTLKNA
jgi:phosphohistidine phosphatase